jgi:hypothetical protein
MIAGILLQAWQCSYPGILFPASNRSETPFYSSQSHIELVKYARPCIEPSVLLLLLFFLSSSTYTTATALLLFESSITKRRAAGIAGGQYI